MKKLTLAYFIGIVAALALVLNPMIALASDVSAALFYGNIQVSNNSTDAENVSTVCSINTTNLINGGFISATANDTSIQYAGSDITFMPGWNNNPWVIQVPSIAQNNLLTYILYTNATGGQMRYFPGAAGMVVNDSATIEPSDNFTITVDGRFDTTQTGANVTSKADALRTFINTSGNISCDIYQTSYTNPTDNVSNGWTNGANAIDNNTGTSADYANVGASSWSPYLYINYDGGWYTHRLRYWVTEQDPDINNWNIDAYYDNAWHTWLASDVTTGSFQTVSGNATHLVSQVRIRAYNGGVAAYDIHVFELDYGDGLCAEIGAVSNGEHTLTTQSDSVLFSLGVDGTATPQTTDLVFNAPLWHIETDNTSFDSKDANGYTSVVTNAIWSSDGYYFDGSGDYITIEDNTIAALYPGSFTWEFWVNPTDFSAIRALFGNTNGNAAFPWEGHINNTSGILTFLVRESDSDTQGGAFNDLVATAGSWNHIVFTGDGSTIKAYLNGTVSATTYSYDGTIATGASRVANMLGVARNSRWMYGTIGEARLYNDDLSQSEVTANYNNTSFKYTGSTIDNYYQRIGDGVPDNANDYSFFTSNVMPYVEYASVSVNGTLAGYWEWEYGSTFTDQSVNSNTATPTFRTTSSDADVSATLLEFLPVSESQAPGYTVTAPTDWVSSSNMSISSNFTDNVTPTFPGQQVIVDIATAGETPQQMPIILMSSVGILALSLTGSYFLRRYNTRSMFFKLGVIGAAIGVLVAVSVIDHWMLYLFLMVGVAIAMGSGTVFAGTGITGHNYIGFLVMSFIGMTMINRIIEGRFIQATDITIINSTLVFVPYNVFGWFTIPVPNLNFLLQGIPALIRWDYSFFGGNAQIIQYLMYSVTAVVSFILFVLALGAVYQVFSRGR